MIEKIKSFLSYLLAIIVYFGFPIYYVVLPNFVEIVISLAKIILLLSPFIAFIIFSIITVNRESKQDQRLFRRRY